MSWDTEMASLNAAVNAAFGCSVTVIKYTAGAYNQTTGVITRSSSEVVVTATRGRSSIDVSRGKRIETVVFRILVVDMATPPNADDTITDGSKIFQVTGVAPSVDMTTWDVTGKRTVIE